MQLWKIRERILDIQEATTGNRVISCAIRVGGVCRDIDAQQGKWIMEQLEWVGRQVKLITPVLRDDFTIRARTMGKGFSVRTRPVSWVPWARFCGPAALHQLYGKVAPCLK